jgi:hypothetical protein
METKAMPRMKVVDQLHLSAIGPNTMGKGTEFEVSDPVAADLERRGLAVRIGDEKQKAPPANKMQAAPQNKSQKPPQAKRGSQAPGGAVPGAE